MDKFLKIVWETQEATGLIQEQTNFFEPLQERLKELLAPKLYAEVEEIMLCCMCEEDSFYATEGMKLAIGVLDGTYKVSI